MASLGFRVACRVQHHARPPTLAAFAPRLQQRSSSRPKLGRSKPRECCVSICWVGSMFHYRPTRLRVAWLDAFIIACSESCLVDPAELATATLLPSTVASPGVVCTWSIVHDYQHRLHVPGCLARRVAGGRCVGFTGPKVRDCFTLALLGGYPCTFLIRQSHNLPVNSVLSVLRLNKPFPSLFFFLVGFLLFCLASYKLYSPGFSITPRRLLVLLRPSCLSETTTPWYVLMSSRVAPLFHMLILYYR